MKTDLELFIEAWEEYDARHSIIFIPECYKVVKEWVDNLIKESSILDKYTENNENNSD